MSKFNTHGGYFAPPGYFRIDTGGSHDENPNGGVQVGVAPDGAPNLLEQDEPVYNDYVYSDNITADKDILAKHNIPQKYAGKLFSEIADTFVDEAEERPLDPVSNETLNAMLVRLADAQEEQKMIAEQKEIQDEIDNLSPEELAQLEAMLSEQEQQEQMMQEQQMQQAQQQMMSPEMYMQPDVAAPQQSGFNPQELAEYPGQIPVGMACGGTMLRKYACGGKKYTCGGKVHRYEGGSQMRRVTNGTDMSDPITEQAVFDDPGIDYSGIDIPATNQVNFWNPFMDVVNAYTASRQPGNTSKKYAIDKNFNFGDYGDIKNLENSDAYNQFTNYVLANSNDKSVQAYLQALDKGTVNADKLFGDDGQLVEGWKNLYSQRRNDQKAGIYHLNPEDMSQLIIAPQRDLELLPPSSEYGLKMPTNAEVLSEFRDKLAAQQEPETLRKPVTPTETTPKKESGFDRRYIEPIMRGGLALYNALQKPDRYNTPRYHPVLPNGRMDLIDPVFNPMDENMAVNNVLASSAGTARAIGNSGLGPSVGATLLSQDYNTGRNIGNAQTSIWDANNQRRNAVIAARNQNGVSQANFDYGINRDRANILNEARRYNIQLGQQDTANNYAAETAQWSAVNSQLEAMGKALSDIAQEDRNRDLANQYSDLYGLLKDFTKYYKG